MRNFKKLGEMFSKILKMGPELESQKLNLNAFAIESEKRLKSIEINRDVEQLSSDLAKWMLENKLPKQLNVYNAFGQPPVTVFSNDDFVVDLYFWMHADTSIHSHAFSGAFKVLFGKSLHETFEIDPITKYSEDAILNKLTRKKSEVLVAGDCRKIISGNSFNHRVVHLSAPTVTLCIRTISDNKIPQWHHFDNGLSILKRELDESIFKKLFYSDYLFEINEESAVSFLTSFIDSLEASELMNLFEQLSVDTMGLHDFSQEVVYNLMMDSLNTFEWFKLYESHCEKAQLLEDPEDNSEKAKLIAHTNFYEYSDLEKTKLINQI